MFDKLPMHQARVLATIKATEQGLLATRVPDLMVVARARWSLARELSTYKHYKHIVVFDPLIETSQGEVRRKAIAMKEACLAADEAYRLYIAHWGAERFPDCWEEYRPAAHIMMSRAREHIETERKQLSDLIYLLSRDDSTVGGLNCRR
jgi:hypothetical protein